MTSKDLDEIEAQLDSTVPYYVPLLIAEIRHVRSLYFDCMTKNFPKATPKEQKLAVKMLKDVGIL